MALQKGYTWATTSALHQLSRFLSPNGTAHQICTPAAGDKTKIQFHELGAYNMQC
jgi:hypothetical protein